MKILDKEYEEISPTEYWNTPAENRIQIIKNNKVTSFREVKTSQEFPVRIEMAGGEYLEVNKDKTVLIKDYNNDSFGEVIISGSDSWRDKDINGILKALLYLETEDDIIKRLKELR